MTTPTAWQLEQAMAAASAFAERLRAENPDSDHEHLLLALDSETDAIDLLRKVIRSVLEDEAMADAAKARAKDITQRARRFEERATSARGVAFAMMDALGLQKMQEADFTVSIRAGSPRPIVTDEEALPDYAVKVTRTPDMAAIREHMKVGPVPGVETTNGLPSLSIRTK